MERKISSARFAVLGLGKLGGILLEAFLRQGLVRAENVKATVHHAENAGTCAQTYGVDVSTDNPGAVREADVEKQCEHR